VYVEEQAHGSADDRGTETAGGGTEGGRCGAGSGCVQAHDLCLESKVWREDVSEAQEAKQLRDENTKLRKLVADLSKAATGRLAAMPLAASVKILQIEMPQNQSRTREPRATREPGNHCASPVLKFGRWKTYLMEPEVTSPIRAAVGAMDKKSLVSYF
jgi:hypothetical protein